MACSIAVAKFAQGSMALAAIMAYKSYSTQRVCRSTLAAEASRPAYSLQASAWLTVCSEEAVKKKLYNGEFQRI